MQLRIRAPIRKVRSLLIYPIHLAFSTLTNTNMWNKLYNEPLDAQYFSTTEIDAYSSSKKLPDWWNSNSLKCELAQALQSAMDSTLVQEWLLLLLQSRRQHKHGEWMQYFEYWFNLEVHFFVVLIPMIVVLPLQSQVQSQNPSPLYSNGGTPNIKKFHFPQSTHQLKKKTEQHHQFLLFLSFFFFLLQPNPDSDECCVVNEKFFGPIFMTQTLCVKWLLFLAAVRWSQHWCGTYCVSLLHTAQ